MSFITDAIDWFVNLISTVWNFFSDLLENFMLFFKYLSSVVGMSHEIITAMPDWLRIFGIITITVSVLFLVLGRDTGGVKGG